MMTHVLKIGDGMSEKIRMMRYSVEERGTDEGEGMDDEISKEKRIKRYA